MVREQAITRTTGKLVIEAIARVAPAAAAGGRRRGRPGPFGPWARPGVPRPGAAGAR